MKLIYALAFLSLFNPLGALAQQAPWGRADVPISARDRVYAADQTSNTVSVIDPSSNTLLGVVRLGDPVPGALSPLYRGQLLVHGLGYSPDGKTLAVVSIASNSVTLIDTATNRIKGIVYVGRSPHEAFFTTDGAELWVTVRGEDYVSVIDPVAQKEIRRIQLPNGPGMTIFSTDGRYGFICSSFTPEMDVVDTKSHAVLARLSQASPFCPNIAVSPENDEVWLTLKDVGRTQVFSAKPPFAQIALLETGPITNHVNFANNRNGKFAYITIGGANEVKAFRRVSGAPPELVATIPVGELPHGIWPSGDGSRVYVAYENGGMAAAIDTISNKVITTIPIGQTSQALVYVPNAVPDGGGTQNLTAQGESANSARLHLAPASAGLPNAYASATVNSLGLLDLVEVAASGLARNTPYELYLAEAPTAPFGKLQPLAILRSNKDGAGIAQAIGPLKTVAANATAASGPRRYLIVTELTDASQVVLRPQL
ncbi:MAG: YncE family protein [Candidatus Acidiferrum sp.]